MIAEMDASAPTAERAGPLLNIVLHQPEIPDNTGNVGRTCVAVGAKLWLVRPLGFRLDDRHLRRAGLDYWEHLDWEAVDDWSALLARLSNRGADVPVCQPEAGGKDRQECLSHRTRRLWLFSKRAMRPYTEAAFQPGDALVFGSESRGLPPSLLAESPDRCLRIPVREEARSLNLAVSVGVAAFEALRQFR
jgi:tRNA (cytidine/uridine-2'-O-)-methyltransferase